MPPNGAFLFALFFRLTVPAYSITAHSLPAGFMQISPSPTKDILIRLLAAACFPIIIGSQKAQSQALCPLAAAYLPKKIGEHFAVFFHYFIALPALFCAVTAAFAEPRQVCAQPTLKLQNNQKSVCRNSSPVCSFFILSRRACTVF